MFRDDARGTIKNDGERCIGCGSCVLACEEKSVGIIALNPVTNTPERMCTLCDGDPQCVKYCPYSALTVVSVDAKGEFYRMAPENIATTLINQWYTISG